MWSMTGQGITVAEIASVTTLRIVREFDRWKWVGWLLTCCWRRSASALVDAHV